jgi:hypothetical protein
LRIAPHDIIRVTDHQVSTDLGGEIAILDITGGNYFGLDGAGARVWALLQEPRTFAEICALITSEYDVDPTRCELDMVELITSLADERLVRIERTGLD